MRNYILLVFILFAVCFVACQPPNSSESSYSSKAGLGKLDKAAYEKFCYVIETAVNQENHAFIDSIFDTDRLISFVTEGIDAPEYYENGFKTGFRDFYTPGTILVSSAGQHTDYSFMRLKSVDPPIGLFRIVGDQGLNYQEIHLSAGANGTPTIKDFYSYQEAELFSQGVRRLYILNLVQEVDDFEHPLADALPLINSAAQLADGGDVALAFSEMKKLPKDILDQKVVLLMLLTMGSDLGEDSLNLAADIFRKQYPNDPLVELKVLDYSYKTQDTTKVFNALARLDTKLGGDVYLDVLKAAILKSEGQSKRAKNLLANALKKNPKLEEPYWLLIDLLITEKDYKGTVDLFESFNTHFEDNAANYIVNENYADFFASESYKTWIAEHPLTEQDGRELFEQYNRQHQGHDGHGHEGHSH